MAAWGLKPPLGSRMGCDELYRSDLADRQKLDRDGFPLKIVRVVDA
ncbi:hypothetical protein NC652_004963 [Populus alba x Populus x berolinensis]|uniref:Uncharacterized protein n=1 Tax=Populus alba x Populus x berolinensis TaxID=444605 RepID=A0AAD6WB51_9ROSI|nr:hypothetical protein NC652_004963 [Populus alba x Populus x berolinensis]KAJ7006275.1 hypothetical protein NC653_005584 [Populus alba x Populus x berolinensis]